MLPLENFCILPYHYKATKMDKIKIGTVLTAGQFFDYLIILSDEGRGIRDWQGQLDFSEIEDIAYRAKKWELKKITLKAFDWVADPDYPNLSQKFKVSPIALCYGSGEYEILDGKHRVGMAKAAKKDEMVMWVGEL